MAYKRRLKTIGEARFYKETIHNGSVSAKKLITAFGIRPPPFLEGFPDEVYLQVLELAISRELSKRDKLPQHNTIDDAVSLLKSSHNIIVLTGAGISTSLGIPDFRSKNTGLYAQLEHLGLADPQEVFDINLFREDPSIFYSVARDILPSSKTFSPTHAFIRLLQDKGKLLTNFTQNIDNLESHAGISPSKLIQCHGSFATATCIECRHHVSGDVIYKDLKSGIIPRCEACLRRMRAEQNTTGTKRKRSHHSHSRKKRSHSFSDTDSGEDDNIAVAGVMKPDITFFGEDLPSAFHTRLVDHDREKVDLVLVIGTSLKVAPVSEVVGVLPKDVPQIYINRDPCGHVNFDVDLLGECDVVVKELCHRAGWHLQHEMVTRKAIEVENIEGWESRWHVRVAGAREVDGQSTTDITKPSIPYGQHKPTALGLQETQLPTKLVHHGAETKLLETSGSTDRPHTSPAKRTLAISSPPLSKSASSPSSPPLNGASTSSTINTLAKGHPSLYPSKHKEEERADVKGKKSPDIESDQHSKHPHREKEQENKHKRKHKYHHHHHSNHAREEDDDDDGDMMRHLRRDEKTGLLYLGGGRN